MGQIYVAVTGNGSGGVSNPSPVEGDIVTVYAFPYSGETLTDLYAVDGGGHSIALAVVQEQTFEYHDYYGNITIYVEFSGSPIPPTMPAWLIPVLKKAIRRRKRL